MATQPFSYDQATLSELVSDALQYAKTRGASSADAEVSEGFGQTVTARQGEVETIEYNRDKGIGVTVYLGTQRGHASSSDFSPKALRDFVVSWCFFWQCCRPPFQNGGDRGQWIYDQWEELPMHEIESADGSRPLPRCTSALDDGDHQSDGEVPTTDTAQGGDEDDVPVAPCELELVRDMVENERRCRHE
jgi:hypothetical protein